MALLTCAAIGIIAHKLLPEIVRAAAVAADAVSQAGGRALLPKALADMAGLPACEDVFGQADALVALGGDGTFLHAQEQAAVRGLPVLCVHFGRLGFLSEVSSGELPSAIVRLMRGEFAREERMMLECAYEGMRRIALNDVILSRMAVQGVMRLSLNVDGKPMDRYAADGVVVATPTGSTAYALSAGGPIVGQNLPCIVLCPICAHTLRARATVLSPDSAIDLRIESDEPGHLVADGACVCDIAPGKPVIIRRAQERAVFVRLHERDFYAHLHRKLIEWSS